MRHHVKCLFIIRSDASIQCMQYFWLVILSPGGSDSKNVCLQSGTPGFDPWVGKIRWRRKWQSTLVLLPGKSHRRRSLVGCSPWGHKKSDTTERLHLHLSHRAVVRMTRNVKCLFIIWSDTSIQCMHSSRVYFLSPSEVYHPSLLLCVHTMEAAK